MKGASPSTFMTKPPAGTSLFNRGPLFQEPPSPPKDEGSTPPSPDGESTTPVNTKPPADSPLHLRALAASGRIKQRKNGSYRMVLDNIDEIRWQTTRPEIVEGAWTPKMLLKKWDTIFSLKKYEASSVFKIDGVMDQTPFEMFKPTLNKSGDQLNFRIKSSRIHSDNEITRLLGKKLDNASLSFTRAWPACLLNCQKKDLSETDLTKADLSSANLIRADLSGADLTDANLTGAFLTKAKLNDTDLISADLSATNLKRANLTDANLTDANLTLTMLNNADLTGAKQTGAIWNNTTCPDGTMNIGTSPCTVEQLNLA